MNASDYKGEFSVIIDINVNKWKEKIINWLISKDKEMMYKIIK